MGAFCGGITCQTAFSVPPELPIDSDSEEDGEDGSSAKREQAEEPPPSLAARMQVGAFAVGGIFFCDGPCSVPDFLKFRRVMPAPMWISACFLWRLCKACIQHQCRTSENLPAPLHAPMTTGALVQDEQREQGHWRADAGSVPGRVFPQACALQSSRVCCRGCQPLPPQPNMWGVQRSAQHRGGAPDSPSRGCQGSLCCSLHLGFCPCR